MTGSQASGKSRVVSAIRETGLCVITDDRLDDGPLLAATEKVLDAGVRLLQFRDNRSTKRRFLERARAIQALCQHAGAAFVVNNEADASILLNADGVHVGQDDLPARLARELVGADAAIGLSISYVREAEEALAQGVTDYLGCGAVYPTGTKPDAEYGGLDLIRAVRRVVDLPILAIGGISAENLHESIEAGADGVAVVSAVYGDQDPGGAARDLIERVAQARYGLNQSSPRP